MSSLEIIRAPLPKLIFVRSDGARVDVHPLWLRERCRAKSSFDMSSHQRLADLASLPSELAITDCRQLESGDVIVCFSDNHESRFDHAELLAEVTRLPTDDCLPPAVPWTDTNRSLPQVILNSDKSQLGLRDALALFFRHGFVVVRQSVFNPPTLTAFAAQFGVVRPTQFGMYIDLETPKSAEQHTGHSPLFSAPHTDFPYRAPIPDVQVLYCLKNDATNEMSSVVDGMAVYQELKARHPVAFRTLATTPVRFRFKQGPKTMVEWRPHISIDGNGEFRGIHFSPGFDSAPLLPHAELDAYYCAKRLFVQTVRSPQFLVQFRLNDGDFLMLNNRRMLHGGASFSPDEGYVHHQYCYIDLDEPRSMYRALVGCAD